MPFRSQLKLPLVRGRDVFIPGEINESLPCLVYRFDVKLGMVLDGLKVRLGWHNLAFASFAQDIFFFFARWGNAFPPKGKDGKVLFFLFNLARLVFPPLDGL